MSRKQSSIPLDFIAIGGSCAAGCRLTHDPQTTQTMLYNSESASLLFAAALFIYAARPASGGQRK